MSGGFLGMLKDDHWSFGFQWSVNWIEVLEGGTNLFRVYELTVKSNPTTQKMLKLTLLIVPSFKNRLIYFP